MAGDAIDKRWFPGPDGDLFNVIAPHLRSVLVQRDKAHRDFRRPILLLVPRNWPGEYEGARIYGMPVNRADVSEPIVVCEPAGFH